MIDKESLRVIMKRTFKTLQAVKNDKNNVYKVEVKVSNYYEMVYTSSNILKLCILALGPEAPEFPVTVKDKSIDIAAVLEIVLQLLPLQEIEFLDEMNELLKEDN